MVTELVIYVFRVLISIIGGTPDNDSDYLSFWWHLELPHFFLDKFDFWKILGWLGSGVKDVTGLHCTEAITNITVMDKICYTEKSSQNFDQYLNLEILQNHIWFGSPIEDLYPINFDIRTSAIFSVYEYY